MTEKALCNIEKARRMRFGTRIAGLVIKPDDDGSEGWAKVLGLIGKMAIATQ